MKKLRLGIIGIGNMGGDHARRVAKGNIPNLELAAVCDSDPERIAWAKKELPDSVKHFATTDELFASKAVDGVLIATPHYDHPILSIEAIEKGLHVLCEKPAGVYTKKVREMNEAAAKADVVFGMMFNQRTIPVHKKIKDLVDSGELGEIKRVNWIITDWFRSQAYYNSGGWRATWEGEGGGVLINQCPHNIDLMQWFCGMPKRVRAFCAFGKYHDIEVEDEVTAYFEYENGATGVFITSTGEAPGSNRLEITCDQGKLVMEDRNLKFFRTREKVSEFCATTKEMFGLPETWNIDIPAAKNGEEHDGILKDWTNAALNGSDLLAQGEEGINSLNLSNAMQLSAWTDDWVDLPCDEELYYKHLQEKIKNSTHEKVVVKQTASIAGSSQGSAEEYDQA